MVGYSLTFSPVAGSTTAYMFVTRSSVVGLGLTLREAEWGPNRGAAGLSPPATGTDTWYLTYDGAEAIGVDPSTLVDPFQ